MIENVSILAKKRTVSVQKPPIDHQLVVAEDKFLYRAVSNSLAPAAIAYAYL